MSTVNEVDILDVVKKLRVYTNALDNTHFLAHKVNIIGDTSLTQLSTKVMMEVDNAAHSVANLLRHVENSAAYRDIVRKYRAPSAEAEQGDSYE